jgi:predicted nucleic acid-binding protein
MRVVSNTSPISNLAIISRLELLKRRYAEVCIPPEVARELAALSHPTGHSVIQSALAQGWLRIEHPLSQPAPTLPFPLDLGETAAIALAVAASADVLLIDEKRGRTAARTLGMAVGGLLQRSEQTATFLGDLRKFLLRSLLDAVVDRKMKFVQSYALHAIEVFT